MQTKTKTDRQRIEANWRALDRYGIKRNPRTARIAESEHVTADWIGHVARSGPPVMANHMIVRLEDALRDAEATAADLAEQHERRERLVAEAVSVEARTEPPVRASAPAGTYENIRRQHRRALDWAASISEGEWLAIVGTIKGGTFTTDATDKRLLQSLRKSSDFCLTAYERFGTTRTVRTADSADAAIAFNGEAANASDGHPMDGPQRKVESGSTTSNACGTQGTIAASDEALTVTTAAIGEV